VPSSTTRPARARHEADTRPAPPPIGELVDRHRRRQRRGAALAAELGIAQDIKLVARCTRNGGFEDMRHGSRFTAEGMYLGGPAPGGLALRRQLAERLTAGPAVTMQVDAHALEGDDVTAAELTATASFGDR
jgi:hypothetical protein